MTQMDGLSCDSYLDPLGTFPTVYKDMYHSISEIMVGVSQPKRNMVKRLQLVMQPNHNEKSGWSAPKSLHPKMLTILEEDRRVEKRDEPMETDELAEFGQCGILLSCHNETSLHLKKTLNNF